MEQHHHYRAKGLFTDGDMRIEILNDNRRKWIANTIVSGYYRAGWQTIVSSFSSQTAIVEIYD